MIPTCIARDSSAVTIMIGTARKFRPGLGPGWFRLVKKGQFTLDAKLINVNELKPSLNLRPRRSGDNPLAGASRAGGLTSASGRGRSLFASNPVIMLLPAAKLSDPGRTPGPPLPNGGLEMFILGLTVRHEPWLARGVRHCSSRTGAQARWR